jgi:N-acetylneuraminic acid mutarotase
MRLSIAAMLVLVLLATSCLMVAKPAFSSTDVVEDTWVAKAPMQVARGNLGVAVVNGKIYAIGGSTESGLNPRSVGIDYTAKGWIVNTNEEYDPATDKWTFKTPMPTPRYAFAIVTYQNKIYCIGGASNFQPPTGFYGAILTGVNEVYDPATDTWETKAAMPTARIGLQANVVDDKIYLIGGYPNRTFNEVYDPATDSWTTKAPMPTVASYYASAVFDNEIYVIGGYGSGNLNQIYDPETDKWRMGAPAPSSITDGAAGATTGMMALKRIYVLGVLDFMYQAAPPNRIYDPKSDRWTFGADAPTNRLNFGVAVVNDTLYTIGGIIRNHPYELSDAIFTATPSAVNEQYTPLGYGSPDPSYDGVAPVIVVVLPGNETYFTGDVGLNFTDVALDFVVDEPVFSVRYVLDGGVPVEISGNATIAGLAVGAHNVSVFGFDASGNMGTSETVYFSVAQPEPFPVVPVAAASAASVAVAVAGLLMYLRRHGHRAERLVKKS